MNKRERVIVGAVKVNKPFVYHNASYECAAWWQDEEAQLGAHPLYLQRQYHSPNNLELVADIKGKVVSDYFPGLWGGVAISNKPYVPRHVGEETCIRKRIEIDDAVRSTGSSPGNDLDVFFKPDWWVVVKNEATNELAKTYRRLPEFWAEYANLNKENFVPSRDGHSFSSEQEWKLGMVGYFGERLSKWARRLQLISRHEGYRGMNGERSIISHEMYHDNVKWANEVQIANYEGKCLV